MVARKLRLAFMLLSVSWAIGVEMSLASSWERQRGNFLRILGLVFLAVIVIVVSTLSYAYVMHGNVGPPFPAVPLLALTIPFTLSSMLSSAVPCAIYRQLVMEPWSPSGTPDRDTVAA